MRTSTSLAFPLLLVLTTACGAGQYSYARTYVPLADEEAVAARADTTAVLDVVKRDPAAYGGHTIAWFGVVTRVDTVAPDGMADLTLQQRTHQERHLCEDESASSCRVTVSDRDGGAFTVHVLLRPADRAGENRVQPGALLVVYGAAQREGTDGVGIRAQYYRHFPRGQFVTTATRGDWRR